VSQPKRQRLKSGDFPLRWKLQRQKFPALFHQSSYLIRNTHSELMRLFWWKKIPALLFAFLALLTQLFNHNN
jgi:hypothetical protein